MRNPITVGAGRVLLYGCTRQGLLKDYQHYRSSKIMQMLLVRRWASASPRTQSIQYFKPSVMGGVPGSFGFHSTKKTSKTVIVGECRRFLTAHPPHQQTDFSKLRRLEDANPERIHGIHVNPDSIGFTTLPGNLVYKFYKWSGNTRKVPLELVHGYFWMLNDLKASGGKPTLPNESIIPEESAQMFPLLKGLTSLSKETTDLPYFFIANKEVKCTLLNISFRDSGYKNIASWTAPFLKVFEGDQRVKAITVSITERRSLYLFRNTLANLIRKNTPTNEHDTTMLYFGSDIDEFRDVLRMHNIMANYVFLVDDLGRIRFASSGEASRLEIDRVIQFAKELSSSDGNHVAKKRSSKQLKR